VVAPRAEPFEAVSVACHFSHYKRITLLAVR
jgi:hypothetical protein